MNLQHIVITPFHQVDILLAEPYFSISSLPWHDVYFWYARTELANRLSETASVLPCCASLRAVGVDFENLWRIRAPVKNCEGFDLTLFDHLIMVGTQTVAESGLISVTRALCRIHFTPVTLLSVDTVVGSNTYKLVEMCLMT